MPIFEMLCFFYLTENVPHDTYFYVYGHRFEVLSKNRHQMFTASHGEDWFTICGSLFMDNKNKKVEYSDKDEQVSKTMLGYFLNYAKTGSVFELVG